MHVVKQQTWHASLLAIATSVEDVEDVEGVDVLELRFADCTTSTVVVQIPLADVGSLVEDLIRRVADAGFVNPAAAVAFAVALREAAGLVERHEPPVLSAIDGEPDDVVGRRAPSSCAEAADVDDRGEDVGGWRDP